MTDWRKRGATALVVVWVLTGLFACADEPDTSKGFRAEQGCMLFFNDHPWLFTVTEPFDPDRFEYTYKVYTHLYDPETDLLLTKGPGGKFTHHRGLFIGWKQTTVEGERRPRLFPGTGSVARTFR